MCERQVGGETSVPCYSVTRVVLTNKSYCERFFKLLNSFQNASA